MGFQRTHYCGELRADHVGQKVVVCGWVHRRRDHGGVIFIDLRDRAGLVQVVFDPEKVPAEIFSEAERLRNEYVIQVWYCSTPLAWYGQPYLQTGAIEIYADELKVLPCQDTAFATDSPHDVDEALRLKYRHQRQGGRK